ncbi:SMP-30/gluconolactonase/LRE family protein [Hyphomonas sp.]|uniref:SMP-30/gluconolactonase/LRE family protein n=1 Tax=Hyphomonas sp. TaxID=87 RepID=UPI00391CF9FA
MRTILILAASASLLAACGKPAAPAAELPVPAEDTPPPAPVPGSLELLWTASGFEAPEGAALAPDGSYFISNIGAGSETEKDGNGYISRLNADGTVASAKFAVGLDAPAGLAVKDGVLYAADRDGVAMFDAATGAAQGKALIEGAGFLNDMTVWKGDVLVSDSGTATIHKITPEGASVFAASEGWAGINGILGDGDRLLITTMTDGKLIDFRGAGAETLIAAGMKDADGVGLIPGGGYLVSSWPGEIHHVSEDGAVTRVVDTRADGILQNDLNVYGDIVIVPNWEPGTVTAWRIVGE